MLMWIVLGIILLADLGLFVADKYIWSFFWLVATGVAAFFFIPEVANVVHAVGWKTLAFEYVPLYLLVGVVVAFTKWIMFLFKAADGVRASYLDFKKVDKVEDALVADNEATRYLKWMNDNYRTYRYCNKSSLSASGDYKTFDEVAADLAPRAKNQADRIAFWVLQWPFVVVGIFVEDLLVKIGRHVARLFDYLFTGVARRILARAFRKVK